MITFSWIILGITAVFILLLIFSARFRGMCWSICEGFGTVLEKFFNDDDDSWSNDYGVSSSNDDDGD